MLSWLDERAGLWAGVCFLTSETANLTEPIAWWYFIPEAGCDFLSLNSHCIKTFKIFQGKLSREITALKAIRTDFWKYYTRSTEDQPPVVYPRVWYWDQYCATSSLITWTTEHSALSASLLVAVVKLVAVVDTADDCAIVQRNLDRLEKWQAYHEVQQGKNWNPVRGEEQLLAAV